MNKKDVRDYPKFLANITMNNPASKEQLLSCQQRLTKLSRELELSQVDIVLAKVFNNRGVKGGKYRLVDVLKTLGADVNGYFDLNVEFFDSMFERDDSENLVRCIKGTKVADHSKNERVNTDTNLGSDFYMEDFEHSSDEALTQVFNVLREILSMDGIKVSSVYIKADKDSAFLEGYYLLRPLIELIDAAVRVYMMNSTPGYNNIDLEGLGASSDGFIEAQQIIAFKNQNANRIRR